MKEDESSNNKYQTKNLCINNCDFFSSISLTCFPISYSFERSSDIKFEILHLHPIKHSLLLFGNTQKFAIPGT